MHMFSVPAFTQIRWHMTTWKFATSRTSIWVSAEMCDTFVDFAIWRTPSYLPHNICSPTWTHAVWVVIEGGVGFIGMPELPRGENWYHFLQCHPSYLLIFYPVNLQCIQDVKGEVTSHGLLGYNSSDIVFSTHKFPSSWEPNKFPWTHSPISPAEWTCLSMTIMQGIRPCEPTTWTAG